MQHIGEKRQNNHYITVNYSDEQFTVIDNIIKSLGKDFEFKLRKDVFMLYNI